NLTSKTSKGALAHCTSLNAESASLRVADARGIDLHGQARAVDNVKTEDDALQEGSQQADVGGSQGDSRSRCPRCDTMDRIVILYQQIDEHATNSLRARRQIELDEADIIRLMVAARKYQEAAGKRVEMVRLEKEREKQSVKQIECNKKEIEKLQAQLRLS
ncbi:hypothetical protein LTR53_016780, partial [Teratosphaeriaceae sp. CCFEE 6253]